MAKGRRQCTISWQCSSFGRYDIDQQLMVAPMPYRLGLRFITRQTGPPADHWVAAMPDMPVEPYAPGPISRGKPFVAVGMAIAFRDFPSRAERHEPGRTRTGWQWLSRHGGASHQGGDANVEPGSLFSMRRIPRGGLVDIPRLEICCRRSRKSCGYCWNDALTSITVRGAVQSRDSLSG